MVGRGEFPPLIIGLGNSIPADANLGHDADIIVKLIKFFLLLTYPYIIYLSTLQILNIP